MIFLKSTAVADITVYCCVGDATANLCTSRVVVVEHDLVSSVEVFDVRPRVGVDVG